MLLGFVLVVAGVVMLWLAADRFVVAAARIANHWGLSPVLIGALVIGFGTSAPELLVSGLAAFRGELDAAVGNVVGSNVANLTLVLGTSAVIAPIAGHLRTVRREGVAMIVAMTAMAIAMINDRLGRIEGIVLLLLMAVASALLVRWSRADAAAGESGLDVEEIEGEYKIHVELSAAAVSMAVTVLGAFLLVEGGDRIRVELGLTGSFIGLTLFALGTSLPELATAVAAARRRQNDLVVGNVLGSNLFNSLLVVGSAATIGPGIIPDQNLAVLILMLVVGAFAGLLIASGNRLQRSEALALLAVYAGFLILIAQNATT